MFDPTPHLMSELQRGFTGPEDGDSPAYRCLFCDTRFEQGVVYPQGEALHDAERAAVHHVQEAHGGPFRALLGLGRKGHGLSDVQAKVIELVEQGASDGDIAAALGGRSVSTVRNHRFQLRKRHREAKVLVVLMDLIEQLGDRRNAYVRFHAALPAHRDSATVTTDEAEGIMDKYFADAERYALTRWPKKQKARLVVLRRLVQRFERGRRYTEPEVREQLEPAWHDHVMLRRFLIDYRFLAREPDGSAYWRTDDPA